MGNIKCWLRVTILNSNCLENGEFTNITSLFKPQQERTLDDQTISRVGEKVREIKLNASLLIAFFKN